MSMRQSIVAGNWKMYGSKARVDELLAAIKIEAGQVSNSEWVVFPPFIFIEQVARTLKGSAISWGAQNMSAYQPGAYTGEISADMLSEFGCRYVLVGHSERRALFGEDDTAVAMKFAQAQRFDLVPILCVGETQKQRQDGQTESIIRQQLDVVLGLEGGVNQFRHAVIAYEPVWAIGTGLSANPEQAQQVHQFIRHMLAQYDTMTAEQLPILYGGSVKAENAAGLFAMPDIDGGLIGGASLDAKQFVEIAKCIN